MKKPEIYLKEYCQKLSDENVKFLSGRFSQKLSGDIAEAVEFLQGVKEIDRWLSSATSADEFNSMVDLIQFAVQKESDRRFSK